MGVGLFGARPRGVVAAVRDAPRGRPGLRRRSPIMSAGVGERCRPAKAKDPVECGDRPRLKESGRGLVNRERRLMVVRRMRIALAWLVLVAFTVMLPVFAWEVIGDVRGATVDAEVVSTRTNG